MTTWNLDLSNSNNFVQQDNTKTYINNSITLKSEATDFGALYSAYDLNGNAVDASANGRNGTETNITYGSSPITGVGSQYAIFNGSSSCVSIPTFDFNSNFTMCTWFKTSQGASPDGNVMPIVGRYGGIVVGQNGLVEINMYNNKLNYYIRVDSAANVNIDDSINTNDNNWHFACLVWDKTNSKVYVYRDNVCLNTGGSTLSGSMTAWGGSVFYIGRLRIYNFSAQLTNYYFNGGIQGVGIYTKALTASQVSTLYNSGVGKRISPTNLTGNSGFTTNTPYYVTTSAASDFTSVTGNKIDTFTVIKSEPTNTAIKTLVSFDGRTTWKYWNVNQWSTSTLANITTNGMSITALQAALTGYVFQAGQTALDIAFSLGTTDTTVTPTISAVALNYSSQNLPPVAPVISDTTKYNLNTVIQLPTFTDPDNDTLTYSVSGLPTGMTFNATTRKITGVADITGQHAITMTANDGKGGVTNQGFLLTLTPVPPKTKLEDVFE